MLEASSRTGYLTTLTSGFSSRDRLLGRVDLRDAAPLALVDHLTLKVRQVVVDVSPETERGHPGCWQVQGGRRAEPSRSEEQHLGVEQLLLALEADLCEQQVARVALALLGGQRAWHIDLVPAVLPQRDPAGHRLDVLVAQILDQRPRRVRRAVARRAVQDHVAGAVRDRALDPRFEIAARHVLGAGDVTLGELLGLADVDDRRAVVHLLVHGRRIDLVDPVLDLAKKLCSRRTHLETPELLSGFNTSGSIAMRTRRVTAIKDPRGASRAR